MTPPVQATDRVMTPRDLSMVAWAAVAVAVLAAIIIVAALIPTARDVLSPGPKTADTVEQDNERRIAEAEERAQNNLALAQGRSIFVVPPPPNALAEDDQAEEEETEQAEGPAPAPSRYGGPDPIAIINNAVWFSDATVVPVGRERSGIRVVSVDNAPWTVRLKWRDVEFDVEIFENTTSTFLQPQSESRGRP